MQNQLEISMMNLDYKILSGDEGFILKVTKNICLTSYLIILFSFLISVGICMQLTRRPVSVASLASSLLLTAGPPQVSQGSVITYQHEVVLCSRETARPWFGSRKQRSHNLTAWPVFKKILKTAIVYSLFGNHIAAI